MVKGGRSCHLVFHGSDRTVTTRRLLCPTRRGHRAHPATAQHQETNDRRRCRRHRRSIRHRRQYRPGGVRGVHLSLGPRGRDLSRDVGTCADRRCRSVPRRSGNWRRCCGVEPCIDAHGPASRRRAVDRADLQHSVVGRTPLGRRDWGRVGGGAARIAPRRPAPPGSETLIQEVPRRFRC